MVPFFDTTILRWANSSSGLDDVWLEVQLKLTVQYGILESVRASKFTALICADDTTIGIAELCKEGSDDVDWGFL